MPAPHARMLILLLVAAALGCSQDAAAPDDDIDPRLIEEANGAGIGSSVGSELPQGAAPFTGPGGVAMQATAEEFIQQLTLDDGTVLRTSGVGIYAVTGVNAAGAGFDRLSFGAANTGSLDSVTTGSYAITTPPTIDFIRHIRVAYASAGRSGERQRSFADEGTITITSLQYFDDTYTCELRFGPLSRLVQDRCDYQVGIVTGTVEFAIPTADGDIVQSPATFTLPIRRRTIVFHMKPAGG